MSTGYESGNREPAVSTIAKALEILNIDANYLYQDETKELTDLVISLDDKELLKKYHNLDDHGKEMVDFTLEKEYERSTALAKQTDNNIVELPSYLEVNAAHHSKGEFEDEERQADDNMLD